MKAPLITLSILANAVLLAALVSPSAATALKLPAAATPTKSGAGPKSVPGFKESVAAVANRGVSVADPGSAWAALSEDPKDFVAELRRMGLPDTLVAAMLTSKLSLQVEARRGELQKAFPRAPYWSTAYAPSIDNDPGSLAELRQMNAANSKIVKDLLGEDALPKDPYTTARERIQYGDLPSDRIELLKLINSDYNEMASGVQGQTMGITLAEDHEKLLFLDRNRYQDIRDALSPEQYQEYILRSSATANTLRSSLLIFDPTEAEYRALFAVRYPFDQKFNTTGGLTNAMFAEYSDAQKQLTEDMKAALTPERAAEYERDADTSYRNALQVTTKLNLSKETASDVWQLQKDIQRRATAINADIALTTDAKTQQLTALQTEATVKATAALGGSRGLEVYRASGGSWIQNLVPAPAPTAAR